MSTEQNPGIGRAKLSLSNLTRFDIYILSAGLLAISAMGIIGLLQG